MRYTPKDYGSKIKSTSTGLKVYCNRSFPSVTLDSLREIKMAKYEIEKKKERRGEGDRINKLIGN
jgi:hypothetical protein